MPWAKVSSAELDMKAVHQPALEWPDASNPAAHSPRIDPAHSHT